MFLSNSVSSSRSVDITLHLSALLIRQITLLGQSFFGEAFRYFASNFHDISVGA
jgi:hypothetical protein